MKDENENFSFENALYPIVRAMLETCGENETKILIFDAHNGRLSFPITNENLHLFRLYRNNISGNPEQLIRDAKK